MLATLAFVVSMTVTQAAAAAPSDDPCATLLEAAPELDGLAVEMAQACQQDAARERLSLHVVLHGAKLSRPAWAFAEMDHQPELDAELAAMGTRVNPFADDAAADPFETAHARAQVAWWWPSAK